MRKILAFCGLLCAGIVYGQQFYVGFGTSITAFDYTNAQGQEIENLLSRPGMNVNLGYRDDLIRDKLFLRIGAVYNSYGAIGSDRRLDNYFEWEVNYLGPSLALDLKLARLRDFHFFVTGTTYLEFLVRGTQTTNNQVFNLVGEDEFNSSLFFVRGGIEVQYPISRTTTLFVNYKYGKSILLENNSDDENLDFLSHQFTLGIFIDLPNCNCSLKK
jgi:hypothetical protein